MTLILCLSVSMSRSVSSQGSQLLSGDEVCDVRKKKLSSRSSPQDQEADQGKENDVHTDVSVY